MGPGSADERLRDRSARRGYVVDWNCGFCNDARVEWAYLSADVRSNAKVQPGII